MIEYKIVDGKYKEGYFLSIDEIEKLILYIQTSDPMGITNIKQEIENYLSHD